MPEDFLPERFLGQHADPGYLAFGTGPRGCIGQSMATRVMQTAVAGILAQFDLEIVGNVPPRMHDKLKSYPAGGVPVRLHPH
jgi:unspecific monooxygenase